MPSIAPRFPVAAAPEQRISVDRALSAITIESAYILQKENELGSIKSGKKADFTILEQDPYAVPVAQLKDIPVWGVVFEGQKFEVPQEIARSAGTAAVGFASDAIDLAEVAKTRGQMLNSLYRLFLSLL